MPTYDDLRAYYQESQPLRELSASAAQLPIASGITVEIDPLWALIHDLEAGWNNPAEVRPLLDWLLSERSSWPAAFPAGWLDGRLALMNQHQGYRRRDLQLTSSLWNRAVSRFESATGRKRLPLILTIVHRPVSTPAGSDTAAEADLEALSTLYGMVMKAAVYVQVDERPLARFAISAGDGILTSAGKAGTVGGILHDVAAGKAYGVTCDHVATMSTAVSDSHGVGLGPCIADTPRVPLLGVISDPAALPRPSPFPGNGPAVNMLDCALVELTPTTGAQPSYHGIASSLTQGQSVVLSGAQTAGHYNLGSLAIAYLFSDGTQCFCFTDAIELIPQPRGPFGGFVGQLFTQVATQGDSGAWVLTAEAPPVWAALFFGEDGSRGFAIRASWVHDWAEHAVGSALTR
jgi:hypothetical protein